MALARITLRQYEAFCAVAELLSFAGAGDRLHLTPSAVSQLVSELEATVGFRLFDRSTRRVAVSAAGRDFLGTAQAVLRQVRLAETAAEDVRQRAAGTVRIGAPLVLAGAVLPAAVREFAQQRPKVVVRIRDTAVDDMQGRVADGEFDLALGPDRAVGPDLRSEAVFSSPWVLWCAPDSPLAVRRTLRWEDLRDTALVAAGRDHERSVEQMRDNVPEGTRIAPVDVVDNVTTALGIAAQGLAATLAPAYVGIVARPMGLVMKRVTSPEAVRQVCLYRSAHRQLPPAGEAFAEFLTAWLRRWHAQQSRTGVSEAAGPRWPGRSRRR